LESGILLLTSLPSKRYLLLVLAVIFLILCFIVSKTHAQHSSTPVITSITLSSARVADGTRLTLTVRATSYSPVEWLQGSFYGPHGNIWGGGFGSPGMFTEISPGLWEYVRHDMVSKYAPTGDYYYEDIIVRNASKLSSEAWPGELKVYIENDIEPQQPVITSVTLSSSKVSEGTRLTLTVRATSNSPVEGFSGSFYGPNGNIWGGGWRGPNTFTEISPGLWEYVLHDTVSIYAPTGDYYYENITVENAGMLESEVWPGELKVYIENDIEPQQPVITSVTLSRARIAEGTRLTLTVRAMSNSPVEWFSGSFYGPNGNIWGGGYGGLGLFTEISPGLWEYARHDIVSLYAPSGEYYYENITVENAGMLESEVWPGDLIAYINHDPEEKEVAPENGEATVDFRNSDVTITIQTDEPGTITVYRYPTSSHTPPDGAASAGIYLNITPSASLQGKPATFTVGYSLPLPDGVDESTLKLYRWSGSAWTVIPDQVLDTTAKTITASVTGFSTFGVFGGSATEDGDTTRRGREITTRFSRIFDYSGTIDHEHKQSLISGVAGLVAAGEGKLGGTHDGMTRESSTRNSYNSNAFYQITTAADALPGDYMRLVSAYTGGNDSAARSGIETNPGGTGSVKENAAASSDGKGTYSDYNATVETNDGKIIIESAVGSASISSKVEGTSFVHFSVTVDGGGQKTGWWDIP
jgi:hypothetical protein